MSDKNKREMILAELHKVGDILTEAWSLAEGEDLGVRIAINTIGEMVDTQYRAIEDIWKVQDVDTTGGEA